MKVSEQIAIMKAYEDGKTIEQKRFDRTEWESIYYVKDYPFYFVLNDYRIATEPKYRPYESVEEAFDEAKKHGFWIRSKDEGSLLFINSFDKANECDTCICDFWADDILNMFVWADDGSTCGVKIG